MFNKILQFSVVIIIINGINACSSEKPKNNETTESPIVVTLASASINNQESILASGLVESDQTSNISTRIPGRIINIFVKDGDRVQKGQLLARVWDEDLKAKRGQIDAAIAEAEASLAAAQKDFDRFNNLYKQQSATAKEIDNVTLQYNSAKAKLVSTKEMRSELDANLSYTSLTAPFSGVITQKLAEVGSMVNPGMPILTIEHNGHLQVSAPIAEHDIVNVHVGDMANVEIKSTGKIFDGKIIEINPSSQFTGGQYVIKVAIPESENKNVFAGMFARLSIPVKNVEHVKGDLTLIPSSAIINRDELTGIYTVGQNNTAMLRWVRLGKTIGSKVEVISGLSKDEKFISSSERRLYNGAPITFNKASDVSMVTSSTQ